MLRTTIKTLLARRLRLITTGFAVLLGVAFMSGTLVLTDTVSKTFNNLFATVFQHTDTVVRGEKLFTSRFGDQRPRIDASLVSTVRAVPGVSAVEGGVQGYAQLVDKKGKAVGKPNNGPPTFGGDWSEVADLNPFHLSSGHAPTADGQVVVDKGTADKAGYKAGDTATVLVQGPPMQVTIVGIAKFGDTDSPGGASFVLFNQAEAQRVIGEVGKFDTINVVATKGVSQEELQSRIAKVLPPGTEAVTGKEVVAENQRDIQKGLKFFKTFLLTFALIALFVGSFIIYNTFSIIVAQRSREMALLRAIGASRRQVLASVMLEAGVVGLIASVLGLLAGIGVAAGLKALLAGFGIDIPAGGVVLSGNTVVTALIAGLFVSLAAALFPARKASKVPPVAAMRDAATETSTGSHRRAVAGVIVTGLGAAGLLYGLFGHSGGALAGVGFGAALTFVGVAVLGPVLAKPVSHAIGAPLPRLKGIAGTLARENAIRNPKRTSATAAALMIGVGLVGFITIFATSAKASFNKSVDRAFGGDFVIDTGTFGFGGASPDMAKRIAALPEVKSVSAVRNAETQIAGSSQFLMAVDPVTFPSILDLDVAQGRIEDLGSHGLAVVDTVAKKKGWKIGDNVPMTFTKTGPQQFTIAAIFTDKVQTPGYVISLAAYEANFADQFDARVYVAKASGVTAARAKTAIETVTTAYPNASVQDQAEYKKAQAAQINTILNFIYVMLALAILIALMGIANTLALSIFERTRELGLLRAVGMTRRQLRATVRWESVIIALFGTAMGLVIGLFFGVALVKALNEQGITVLRIPIASLAVVTVIAALAGVAAAILPARRASKLDVLNAIATA
jgi:putative ABC transport system permease protein